MVDKVMVAVDDEEIIDDISGRSVGKEIQVVGIASKDEIHHLLLQVGASNPLVKTTLQRHEDNLSPLFAVMEVVVIECRVVEIFADLAIIRKIRAERPLVPIIALSINGDPEFAMMVFQENVNDFLLTTVTPELLAAHIRSLHQFSESSRITEIKNQELVETMRSLREANEDLKIATMERIAAERQRSEAEKRAEILKQTKEILDNLVEGFFTVDTSLNIGDSVSSACNRIFQVDIAGKPLGGCLNLEPDKEILIKMGFSQIFENFIPTEVTLSSLPARAKTQSGKIIELHYNVMVDEAGNPKKIIVIAADITLAILERFRAKARDDMNRVLIHILRNEDSFRNFLGDFKKECEAIRQEKDLQVIKRLFHTMKGNSAAYGLEQISKKIQLVETQLEKIEANETGYTKIGKYAAIVEGHLKKFLENHHELLQIDYAKAQTNRFTLTEDTLSELYRIAEVSPLDVKKDLETILDAIKRKPVSLYTSIFRTRVQKLSGALHKKINLDLNGLDLRINYELLNDVMKNLIHVINNSCDHGIELPAKRKALGKSETGTLRVSFERPEHAYLNIVIEDDGAGIDGKKLVKKSLAAGIITAEEAGKLSLQESYNLIFRDNVSTKETVSDISGRGVGMSALKREVELLHGTITIQSTPQKGTRFDITIPYPKTLQVIFSKRQTPKLLVCEDDTDLLAFYENILTDAGFEVTACANGLDAILELSRQRFSVFLTDLVMPGINGADVVAKIKRIRNDNNLMPIIVISGYVTEEIRQALSIYPEVTIIEKPASQSALLEALDKVLGEAPALAA